LESRFAQLPITLEVPLGAAGQMIKLMETGDQAS
jgi:hypothetical protein